MHLRPCSPRLILALPLFLMSGCTPRADLAPVVLHNQRFSGFNQEIESPYRNRPEEHEAISPIEQNEIDDHKNKGDNNVLPADERGEINNLGSAPIQSGTKYHAANSGKPSIPAVALSDDRQKSPPVRSPAQPPKTNQLLGSSNALPEDRSGTRSGGKAKQTAEKTTDLSPNTSINSTDKKKRIDRQKRPHKAAAAADKPIKLKKNSAISIDSKNMLMLNFQWPFKGKIKKNFSQTGSKGIDIIGSHGQTVRASEAGKVVYSGQGLIGFGNLLIIKHNSGYLSAYANNSSLMVKEGQKVRKGQDIAKLGAAVSRKPVLHFEIRKNGKSVNPLSLLPSK
jgi:murein DD-endopeptidase MepM/ murein hydrolase activator NlpD